MNKKARFDAINALLAYCYFHPELRIGQIIINFASGKDIFYCSDEEVARYLQCIDNHK